MSESAEEPGPYLGLDVGSRRIGVARADRRARIAMPLKTVAAGRGARPDQEIAQMIRAERVPIVVVGWPLTLDGEEGRATGRVEKFIQSLLGALHDFSRSAETSKTREPADLASRAHESEAFNAGEGFAMIPEIIRWDERMTTTAAESFLVGANVSRARRREVVDQIAATHILQGYLDSLK